MKEKFFFASTLLLAISIRFFLIFRDSVPFPYDMGRDLLWAKDISFYHIPTLIGPAGSIWGVYFGPLWFYYLSIPLYISGGHPLSSTYATSAVVISTGILSYFLFSKYFKKSFALLFAIIIFFSSIFVNISTYAFHANILPLLTLLTIYFLFLSVVKRSIFISLSFLTISLMFHADPAGAIVFTPIPVIVFLLFKVYKKASVVKSFLASVALFTIPFIPQIIFEFRNEFIETKSLIAYFKGENPSLSGGLPFLERIVNRFEVFFEFFKSTLSPENNFMALIFLSIIIIGIIRISKKEISKNLEILFKINLLTLSIVFFIFAFLVNVEVKIWYLYGVSIIFVFLFAISLYTVKNRFIVFLFLTFFLSINLYPYLTKPQVSGNDPAKLKTQLKAIDLIYRDSHDPFSVYVFTPSIYDFHYQYLFWWYGIAKNMGLPNEFAYLPEKPAYVKNKEVYQATKHSPKTIYLIAELSEQNPHYTRNDWFKNFREYRTEWTTNINDAILVEKRNK